MGGPHTVAAVCDRRRADRLCSTALTERRYRKSVKFPKLGLLDRGSNQKGLLALRLCVFALSPQRIEMATTQASGAPLLRAREGLRLGHHQNRLPTMISSCAWEAIHKLKPTCRS